MIATRTILNTVSGNRRSADEQTLFLDRPGGRIAFEDHGKGPLVVLLPGIGDLRSQYRFLAPRLRADGYRTVAVDLRGHGGSTVGWSDYGSESAGRDLVALIEHLGAGPALVVGNSFGAAPAVWAAAERPDVVSGLALIGPFVRDHPMPAWQRTMLRILLSGPWKVRAWDAYYASLHKAGLPVDHVEHRRAIRANLSEPGRFDAVRAMMLRSDTEIERRLAQLSAPTLVIMGAADPDFPDPEEEARVIADSTGGRYVVIDRAGHYPHVEVPEPTHAAIAEFLASVEESSQRAPA